MAVTRDDYISLLSALLPPGPAWSPDDPAVKGAAPSLLRVHQRADALMHEIDPRTTTELINRWERIAGLPDECIPEGTQTIRQRQRRLDAKLNLAGGINEAFYLAQLEALGKKGATITRYIKSPFKCISPCTEVVDSPEWRYYWQVNMPASVDVNAMTCTDNCASPLRWWGDTVVECVLTKLCPSHTYVVFKYPE
ncbi:YmfQ family protein [Kosakonia pseudosacchari]|uniref:YmfQ family protein n=1 Tax=Kosakonia pseudosacchari TaxID=1646340 RepID=UPI000A3D5177|nr:YmfQ family protein [Kosakonia pseudosacchari]